MNNYKLIKFKNEWSRGGLFSSGYIRAEGERGEQVLVGLKTLNNQHCPDITDLVTIQFVRGFRHD